MGAPHRGHTEEQQREGNSEWLVALRGSGQASGEPPDQDTLASHFSAIFTVLPVLEDPRAASRISATTTLMASEPGPVGFMP